MLRPPATAATFAAALSLCACQPEPLCESAPTAALEGGATPTEASQADPGQASPTPTLDGEAPTATPTPPEMLLIPAGLSVAGYGAGGEDASRGAALIDVPPFYLDRTEVTVDAYGACVDDGGCTEATSGTRCNLPWRDSGRGGYPINCVTWDQARAFCAWAGKRLPTEVEWEKAARGSCGSPASCREAALGSLPGGDALYPWGDAPPTCARVNARVNGDAFCVTNGDDSHSDAVGRTPAGDTPAGLVDMAGNVAEWVEDCWHSQLDADGDAVPDWPADGGPWALSCEPGHVIRGGAFNSAAPELDVRARAGWGEDPKSHGILGIRCASDAP